MFLKDILVYVDDAAGASIRIETAAALTSTHGARLTGLCVHPTVEVPYLAQSFADTALTEALTQAANEASERARALFARHAEAAHPHCRWRQAIGTIADEVIAFARYADLVILGPSDLRQPSGRRLSGQVVLASGAPILMVPERPAFPTLGQHVLVAWNASAESVRAVRAALPILQKAATVEVLVIVAGEPDAETAPAPGAQILDYLARHGVTATVKLMRLDEVYGVGGSILARAEGIGADLIVMGAFGRSRLREAMVGSTTGTLLTRSPVPLLVSH
jgi:nucleotide-binding universal stress UspA family protein